MSTVDNSTGKLARGSVGHLVFDEYVESFLRNGQAAWKQVT